MANIPKTSTIIIVTSVKKIGSGEYHEFAKPISLLS